jgi:DNA-binding MarR family transcriptional regulator
MGHSKRTADSLGIIELELAKLVRHLETFGRRTSVYAPVDRAGYLALRTLARLGPTSSRSLADALHLDASTVTRQVSALRAAGLIDRYPDPLDRRSSTLALSAEGHQVMRVVEAERRRQIHGLVADWTDAEQARLAQTLTKFNDALIEAVTPGDGQDAEPAR